MDTTPRTEALRAAKALIGSHGIVTHMNKYNRDLLAREIDPATTGIRYEFQLDPTRNSWADNNPSCTLQVIYGADPKGSRVASDGSLVVDNYLRVGVSTSGTDMDVETLRRRENMVSLLGMLCEMLTVTLPQTLTLVMETPEIAAANARKAAEQKVGHEVYVNLGESAFKGLRRGGSSRSARLTAAYRSTDGKYPETGTYRYRHVRSIDSRGRPREVFYYLIRVFNGGDGSCPPSVTIRRVDEVQFTPTAR